MAKSRIIGRVGWWEKSSLMKLFTQVPFALH